MSTKKYTISTLLNSGFFIVTLLLFIVSLTSYVGIEFSKGGFTNYRYIAVLTNLSGRLQANMLKMRLDVKDYVISRDEAYLAHYNKDNALMHRFLDQSLEEISDPEKSKIIQEIKSALEEYEDSFDTVVELTGRLISIENDDIIPSGEKMLSITNELMVRSHEMGDLESAYYVGNLFEHVLTGRMHVAKFIEKHRSENAKIAEEHLTVLLDEHIVDLLETASDASRMELVSAFQTNRDTYVQSLFEYKALAAENDALIQGKLDKIGPVIASGIEKVKLSLKNEQDSLGPRLLNQNLRVLQVVIGVSVFALIISLFISRRIAAKIIEPLGGEPSEMADIANRVANGDLTIKFDDNREVHEGSLYQSIRNMVRQLHAQTLSIQESANGLASSITQISSTSAELAVSSDETSTAITEIMATIEEVRQTSQVASDSSNQVAEKSDYLQEISENGQNASKEAILGMNKIKHEMDSVAESIVDLSEKTQSIGEILSTVNDLSDQSNLLSVNASIEAAKAGEYGKGFAVVAKEVKNLADQSKDATRQIKLILEDIQRATSKSVMATERTSKAVDKGQELSGQSATSIATLFDNISESTEVSSQIAATSQQQVIGMNEIATAMSSMNSATAQNVDGAKQLEESCQMLGDLSQELKKISSHFKLS